MCLVPGVSTAFDDLDNPSYFNIPCNRPADLLKLVFHQETTLYFMEASLLHVASRAFVVSSSSTPSLQHLRSVGDVNGADYQP